MAYVAPIKKEDKKKGIIIAFILHVILLLVFLFVSIEQTDPPFPQEEVVMIMEFSEAGSGSSGGSESKAEESSSDKSESNESVEEVVEETPTQEEESPVSTPTQSSNSDSESESESESNNPTPLLEGNPFSGSGNGEDGGSGHGTGDNGSSTGSGPGNIGGGGVGDGSSRKVQFSPDLNNLTSVPAQVAVEIKIDNTGKVISAEALPNNSRTTTTDTKILKTAKKKALEFKYKPTSASTKYDIKIIILNFKIS